MTKFASLRQLELPFPIPRHLALVRLPSKPAGAILRLQKQESRLLRRIAQRQAEVAESEALVRQVLEASGARIQPLYDQMQQLLAEIRELLLALLLAPRFSRQKRALVHDLFVGVFGELPTFDEPETDDAAEAQAAADFRAERAAETESEDADAPDEPHEAREADDVQEQEASGQDAVVTRPVDAREGSGELRSLFRKLAAANHPDHTTDDRERVRRTHAMKELTLAYEAGDLAALLRLQAAERRGDGIDRRRADSERLAELRANVRDLKRQLVVLETRLSELGDEQAELPSFRRTRTGEILVTDPFELELQGEVTKLTGLRDFVQGFRDGKVSLKAFKARVEGPGPASRA